MDILRELLQDRKLRITLGVAGVFLFVSIFGLVLQRIQQPQDPAPDQTDTAEVHQEPLQREYPDVQFSNYAFETADPALDERVYSYTFQSTFTQTQAENLAERFGFQNTEIDILNTYVVVRDPAGSKVLNYDTKNGTFYMYDGKASETGDTGSISDDPLQQAEAYLEKVELQDSYIECTHWYKTNEVPDTTFVECHRQWDRVGYPILNTLGAMNLPSGFSLSDIKLGEVYDSGPRDANVIMTSDNRPGLSRPNHFNTYTIALKDNSVSAITSTMRPLEKVIPRNHTELKTPDEAKAELQQERNNLTLVWPAGEGLIDYDKVFQDQEAVSDSVVVTDFIISYLEEPMDIPQRELIPAYLFKGTARLANGLDIEFLDVVPALKDETPVLGISTDTVLAQTICGDEASIQYCTFQFGPTRVPVPVTPTVLPTLQPTPTNIPTIPPTATPVTILPTDTPTPTEAPKPKSCPNYNREVILPSGMKVGYYSLADVAKEDFVAGFFYIPQKDELINGVEDVPDRLRHCRQPAAGRVPLDTPAGLKLIRDCVIRNYLNENDIRRGGELRALCQPDTASPCAVTGLQPADQECYPFTLGSPNMYVYGHTQDVEVSLQSPGKLTYSYPPTEDQKWVFRKGMSHVYYEYEKTALVQALKQHQDLRGYHVSVLDIPSLIQKLSSDLGLNQRETQDWLLEAERELGTFTERYVNIYVVPNVFLNAYLPLSTDVYTMARIHLYVQEAHQSRLIKPPHFSPIQRNGITLIETGILTQ